MTTCEWNNRRERNRLSQKASRERQANYVKELEKRLDDCAKPQDDRVAELGRENTALRRQLAVLQKKLDHVLAVLRNLSQLSAEIARTNVRWYSSAQGDFLNAGNAGAVAPFEPYFD